jgi:hypothetical protein
MFAYPVGANNGGSMATTLLVIVGLAIWLRGRQFDLVGLFAIPLALGLIASFLGRYPYAAAGRLTQHVGPMICLAAAVGLTRLLEFPRVKRFGPLVTSLVLTAIAGGSLVGALAQPYREPEEVWTRKFFRDVYPAVQPGDLVLSSEDPDNPHMSPNLRWYALHRRATFRYAGAVSDETIAEVKGNVWILAFRAVGKVGWTPAYDMPEAEPIRRRVQAAAPNRVLAERVTYTLPAERKGREIFLLHLERWATPTQQPLPHPIPVWPRIFMRASVRPSRSLARPKFLARFGSAEHSPS